jgi:uncharacterized protein involved in outer membrane biogenesis
MKKILLWTGIGVIGLIVVLFLARNFIVKKAVEVGTYKMTGFPLQIGGLNIGLFSGQVQVSDLKLTNPPEFKDPRFVDLPLFKVDYSTFSMLRGAPHIKELLVNVNEVVIVKNNKGQTNATMIQEKLSPPTTGAQAGGEKKPATAKKTPYRVDLIRVHVGTVIIRDFSKSTPTERKMTLNRDVVFKDVTESTSISTLVMRTILGPIGDVAGDLVKGTLKDTGQNFEKATKGFFDSLQKSIAPADKKK